MSIPNQFFETLFTQMIQSANPRDLFNMTQMTDEKKTAHTQIKNQIRNKTAAEHLKEFDGVPNLPEIIYELIYLTKARDPDGRTILHHAVHRGDLAMVKLVIHFDETLINTSDKTGLTPLSVASFLKHAEIVKWLLDPSLLGVTAKADVNHGSEIASTALHEALGQGHREVAEILVANGADKNRENFKGFTPGDQARFKSCYFNPDTGEGLDRPRAEIDRLETLARDFAPARGLLTIEQMVQKLGLVPVGIEELPNKV